MAKKLVKCPFVYANGRQCEGDIYRAKVYGPREPDGYVAEERAKKYRLWCSLKGDHAGVVSDWTVKERMEFYPQEIAEEDLRFFWSSDILEH